VATPTSTDVRVCLRERALERIGRVLRQRTGSPEQLDPGGGRGGLLLDAHEQWLDEVRRELGRTRK